MDNATMRIIGDLMLDLGIMPHLNGYLPLFEGVRILAGADRTQYISYSEVIPQVNALTGLSDSRSAMRTAIAQGAARAQDRYRAVFHHTSKPTNMEFLCTVAEIVRDRVDRSCPKWGAGESERGFNG